MLDGVTALLFGRKETFTTRAVVVHNSDMVAFHNDIDGAKTFIARAVAEGIAIRFI